MIVSTSTIRFLALAALAVSAGATNSIRGNTNQAQDLESSPQDRDLMEIEMNVGLNKMVCKEDTSEGSDGSIVCTFRIMPPTPTVDMANTLYNCLSTSKANFCLKSEVSQIMYNDVPPEALVPVTPVTLPQKPTLQQPVLVNPNIVGSVGTCPSRQQLTGLGCSQYIPSGSTQTLCVYGQTRCECKLFNNDPSIAVGWKCYVSQNPGAPLPAAPSTPNPPASTNGSFSAFQCRPVGSGCSDSHPIPSNCLGTPACCPNNIIEDWSTSANTCSHNSNNNLLRPPTNNVPVSQPPASNTNTVTATATTYQEGIMDFTFTNDPKCPTSQPSRGGSCNISYLTLCYYREVTGVYMGCNCPKYGGTWQCNQRG